MYQNGISYSEAVAKLNGLLGPNRGIVLRNDNDGEEARLSKASVGKLTSNTAVRKSIDNGFTREQHYAVVSDIDNLYRRALEVCSHSDKHGNPDVIIHRLAAPLHFNDAVSYITVKESMHRGRKIYSAELIEIEKLGGMLEGARISSHSLPSPSLNECNIDKLFTATNKIQQTDEKVNR
jgi:hypothetical protein